MTTQTAPRRRNPKGGRHFAGAVGKMNGQIHGERLRRRMQSAGHDARIHFSAAC
jgi:hypothetical protein